MHSTQYSALVSSEFESLVFAEADDDSQRTKERRKGKTRSVGA
jgi:hypothetical protein